MGLMKRRGSWCESEEDEEGGAGTAVKDGPARARSSWRELYAVSESLRILFQDLGPLTEASPVCCRLFQPSSRASNARRPLAAPLPSVFSARHLRSSVSSKTPPISFSNGRWSVSRCLRRVDADQGSGCSSRRPSRSTFNHPSTKTLPHPLSASYRPGSLDQPPLPSDQTPLSARATSRPPLTLVDSSPPRLSPSRSTRPWPRTLLLPRRSVFGSASIADRAALPIQAASAARPTSACLPRPAPFTPILLEPADCPTDLTSILPSHPSRSS